MLLLPPGHGETLTASALVAFLVRDALDTLPVGSYGLYELLWTLNAGYPDLSREEKVDAALVAVRTLVREHDVTIVALLWPSPEIVRKVEVGEVDERSFDDPQAGIPYLAMVMD